MVPRRCVYVRGPSGAVGTISRAKVGVAEQKKPPSCLLQLPTVITTNAKVCALARPGHSGTGGVVVGADRVIVDSGGVGWWDGK
eukprot:scaffold51743_cov76-Phaeocystis_antarctica.AAC.4